MFEIDNIPLTDHSLYVIRTDTPLSESDFETLTQHLRDRGVKDFVVAGLGINDSVEVLIRDLGLCPTCGTKTK